MALSPADEGAECRRCGGRRLLHEPVEEEAPRAGCSAVEPERVFVEVVVQVLVAYSALVGAEQSALQEGSDPVHAGHGYMGRIASVG